VSLRNVDMDVCSFHHFVYLVELSVGPTHPVLYKARCFKILQDELKFNIYGRTGRAEKKSCVARHYQIQNMKRIG